MQEFCITINDIPMYLSYDASTQDKAYITQLERIKKYMEKQASKRLVGRPVGGTAFSQQEMDNARELVQVSDADRIHMTNDLVKTLGISRYRAKKLLTFAIKMKEQS